MARKRKSHLGSISLAARKAKAKRLLLRKKCLEERAAERLVREREVARILSQLDIEIEPESSDAIDYDQILQDRQLKPERSNDHQSPLLGNDIFCLPTQPNLSTQLPGKRIKIVSQIPSTAATQTKVVYPIMSHNIVRMPSALRSIYPKTNLQLRSPSVKSVTPAANLPSRLIVSQIRPPENQVAIPTVGPLLNVPTVGPLLPSPQNVILTMTPRQSIPSTTTTKMLIMPSTQPLLSLASSKPQIVMPSGVPIISAPRIFVSSGTTITNQSNISPVSSTTSHLVVPVGNPFPSTSERPPLLVHFPKTFATSKPVNMLPTKQFATSSDSSPLVTTHTVTQTTNSSVKSINSSVALPTGVRSSKRIASKYIAPTITTCIKLKKAKLEKKQKVMLKPQEEMQPFQRDKNPRTYTSKTSSAIVPKVKIKVEKDIDPVSTISICQQIKVEPEWEDFDAIAENGYENRQADSLEESQPSDDDSYILPDVKTDSVTPAAGNLITEMVQKKKDNSTSKASSSTSTNSNSGSSDTAMEERLSTKDMSMKIRKVSYFEENDMADPRKAAEFFLMSKQVMASQNLFIKDMRKMLARIRLTVDVLKSEDKISEEAKQRLVRSFDKS